MNKQQIDTKPLNEKLLKFVGIEYKFHGKILPCDGYYLNGICIRKTCPDLVHELGNQYKYLWPEIRKRGYMIRYQYSQILDEDFNLIWDWTYYCHIYYVDAKHPKPLFTQHEFKAINKDSPALACALAIDQLINSLEKEKSITITQKQIDTKRDFMSGH